jgi:transglutaminase-like putative cysteine protease
MEGQSKESAANPFPGVEEAALLAPTPFIQSDAPQVVQFAQEATAGTRDDVDKGVKLYYAVRDGIRYDPYSISLDADCYYATTVLRDRAAFCIPKAILLASAARAVGIPSGVGFADVRNHLNTEKLRKAMGSDLFIYHGYTLLKLGGRWFKVTPAFNLSLCEKFGVRSLEFDGTADALLHPYDSRNRRHMEYVRERGNFAEFPYEEIVAAFRSTNGQIFQKDHTSATGFEEETPLDT